MAPILLLTCFHEGVKVRGVVANPLKHELRIETEFIADAGAIHSVIPHSMAEKLELKVMDKRRFKIASGEIVEYSISEAYVTVEGRRVTSLAALGSEKTPILELLGLQVDPVTWKLIPFRANDPLNACTRGKLGK